MNYERSLSQYLSVCLPLSLSFCIYVSIGRIVVLGSIVKSGVLPGASVYSSSKVAVEILSNTLAQELGSKGVTVNTVHPGPIDTDMMNEAAPTDEAKGFFADMSPMKRVGTVADAADAVSLFVSESSRWISGQSIIVAGSAHI
jgi:3-oxoacyl-[acyl-carrier protein] reductase